MVAIAFGLTAAPFDLLPGSILPGNQAAYGQASIDVSNGNSIRMGQKSPRGQGGGGAAQHARPSLGQAFGHDESTRAYKLARREYEQQIRRIRFKYLAGPKSQHEPTVQRGLRKLEAFTAPAAVGPLVEVLRDENETMRDWLLDHLRDRVEAPYGQATLTWLSIYDEDETMREAARQRLTGDANPRSQYVIDYALRTNDNDVVNHAALAAGKFKLVEAIPLLISTQAAATSASTSGTGDLAFIQIQRQRFFVSDLQPVVGTGSAGFDPELSVLQEGTVMAIQDAVVEFRRTDVHRTLRELVREDYGKPVDFGFNVGQWKEWYREEYVPFKRAQLREQNESSENADAASDDGG